MQHLGEPKLKELPKKEVNALLRRNNVGRIAFSHRDRVDIRPVHYLSSKGWLFGRTSPGDKLTTLGHNRWVAFEVDEITGPLDWKSVIVRGTFYRLADEGSIHDRRLYRRALRAIRKVAPAALTENDPLPFRTEVFGISIDRAAGRSSSTAKRSTRSGRP